MVCEAIFPWSKYPTNELRLKLICKRFKFKSSAFYCDYLIRIKKIMINCMFTPLRRNGVEKLFELCTESEIEQDMNTIIRIGNVITAFPAEMIEIAGSYDEDNSNYVSNGLTHIMSGSGDWKKIMLFTMVFQYSDLFIPHF